MRDVEFEIAESAHSGSAAVHKGRRQRARVPAPVAWTALLAIVLILAGAALTQRADPGILNGDASGELHYVYSDGVHVTSWRWDSPAEPDQYTVARIGTTLAPTTDVPEWLCRFTADAPQEQPVPYPGPGDEPDGSIVCTASVCREVDGHATDDGSVPCVTSAQWVSPVDWERPEDDAAGTD